MTKTARGIYHNLYKSKYAISNGEIAFFFSSKFYRGKFLNEYMEHRKIFRQRIARAIEVQEMNTSFLADIHLYKSIEKRGFRAFLFDHVAKNVDYGDIMVQAGDIKWQELHQFALAKMTEKNTLGWLEMQGQKLEELLKITG